MPIPTVEQVEQYIKWAEAEAGPECADEWFAELSRFLQTYPARVPDPWEVLREKIAMHVDDLARDATYETRAMAAKAIAKISKPSGAAGSFGGGGGGAFARGGRCTSIGNGHFAQQFIPGTYVYQIFTAGGGGGYEEK